MKEIKAYGCEFCKKYGKQKSKIKKHEEICFHNPITKSCATCIHLHQKEFMRYPERDTPFGNNDPWIDYIPVCAEGVDVSHLEDGEKNVYLKTRCPLWESQ